MTLEQKIVKMLRHMNEHCEYEDCLFREGKLARDLAEKIERSNRAAIDFGETFHWGKAEEKEALYRAGLEISVAAFIGAS